MPEKLVKQDEQEIVDTQIATVEPTQSRFEDDINDLKSSIAGLAETVRNLSVPAPRVEQVPTTPTPVNPGLLPGEITAEQLQADYQRIKRAADEQGLDGEFVANNALADYNAKRVERLKAAAEEKARSHYHSIVSRYPVYKDSYESFMALVRQSDPSAIITNQVLADGSPILDILLDRAQGKISRERFAAKPDSIKPAEPSPESGARSAGAVIGKEGKAVVPKSRTKSELEWMARMGVTEEQMQIEDARYEEVL